MSSKFVDRKYDFALFQIMAAEEMKKNVEKLDELDAALMNARDELIVRFCKLRYIA